MDNIKRNESKRYMSYLGAVTVAFLVILASFIFVYRNMAEVKINQKKSDAMFDAQKVDYYLSKNKENLNLAAANIENYIRQGQTNEQILAYMQQESTATSAVVDENFSGIYGWINGEYIDGMGYEPDESYVPQERPWYIKAAAANGQAVLITPYIDSQTGRMVVSLSKMLEDNDSVLSMDIFLDYLKEIVDEKAADGEHLIICDEMGNVVAGENEEIIGTNNLVIDRKKSRFAIINEETSNYEISVAVYEGKRCFCYDQTIIGDWHVILLVERRDVLESLWYIYLVAFISMTIIFFIETIIFRKMNRQISFVERYSGRLSAVADIYLAMYDIDLEKDDYSVVKTLPFIANVVDKHKGSASAIIADVITELCEPQEEDRVRKFANLDAINEAMKNVNTVSIEVQGKLYQARLTFVVKNRAEDGTVKNIMLLIEDIDAEVAKRKELIVEANTDKLTGLLNRRAWEEALIETRLTNNMSGLTVFVMDLNGLKKTNDNLGHAAGDEIIVAAAHMMLEYFGKYGEVFRLGGDEFSVIVKNKSLDTDKEIEEFKKLVSTWKGELVDGLTVSVGYANGDVEEVSSVSDLLKLADMRMYEDKSRFYGEK